MWDKELFIKMIKVKYRGEVRLMPLEEYDAVKLMREIIMYMNYVDDKLEYKKDSGRL